MFRNNAIMMDPGLIKTYVHNEVSYEAQEHDKQRYIIIMQIASRDITSPTRDLTLIWSLSVINGLLNWKRHFIPIIPVDEET